MSTAREIYFHILDSYPATGFAFIGAAELQALEHRIENAAAVGAHCARAPNYQLLQLIAEVRYLRGLSLTRNEATAALWACRHARTKLEGARHIDALDEAIGKLVVVEIAGLP
jgi:hypothetical protein